MPLNGGTTAGHLNLKCEKNVDMSQQIILSQNIVNEVGGLCAPGYDKVFVLADENTASQCLPRLEGCAAIAEAGRIVIGATDTHKTLDTLAAVWRALVAGGASRRSLLVCLGGGMVTDLGGFAAATFKRGIDFVNVPTTLLAMVDAAVGGKTGINFEGLKNEVGAFCEARAVVIDTAFLRTLGQVDLRSGYAEMLKHALIEDAAMWRDHLDFDLAHPDLARLQEMVARSIGVKSRVAAADPREQGLRKALNLGHTVGHAFESFALERNCPVPHGYAVAWGLVGELYLSAVLRGFPTGRLRATVAFINEYYGRPDFTCKDYDRLCELMRHDKKNAGGDINFTLLAEVGDICLDCHADRKLLLEMFDFVREG